MSPLFVPWGLIHQSVTRNKNSDTALTPNPSKNPLSLLLLLFSEFLIYGSDPKNEGSTKKRSGPSATSAGRDFVTPHYFLNTHSPEL